MSDDELKEALGSVVSALVPVAGTLMALACEQDFIHEVTCTCRLCRAFVATQKAQNDLEAVMKGMDGTNRKAGDLEGK